MSGPMCCKRLYRNWGEHPCKQKAKVERDGKPFCTIHDPERVKVKRAERQARWDARTASDRKRYALESAAPDLYRALNDMLEAFENEGDPPTFAQRQAARAALNKAEGIHAP